MLWHSRDLQKGCMTTYIICVLSLVIQLFVFPVCKILQKALEVTTLSQKSEILTVTC